MNGEEGRKRKKFSRSLPLPHPPSHSGTTSNTNQLNSDMQQVTAAEELSINTPASSSLVGSSLAAPPPAAKKKKEKVDNSTNPRNPRFNSNAEPRKPRQKNNNQSSAASASASASSSPSLHNFLHLRRWGHTSTLVPLPTPTNPINQFILSFAGYGADSYQDSDKRSIDHRLNSVVTYDCSPSSTSSASSSSSAYWQPQSCTGILPEVRELHSAVLIPAVASTGNNSEINHAPTSFSSSTCSSPHLLVFGGRSNPLHSISSISLLDVANWKWLDKDQVDQNIVFGEGITPDNLARFRHTAVWIDHKMIVYGGVQNRKILCSKNQKEDHKQQERNNNDLNHEFTTELVVLNDVLVLDTAATPMRWERIHPVIESSSSSASSSSTSSLPARYSHACCYDPSRRRIYFYGGLEVGEQGANPHDSNLYSLTLPERAQDGWVWRNESERFLRGDNEFHISSSSSSSSLATLHPPSVSPPPLCSHTLHLLSPRHLLLLGGISPHDMYSTASVWICEVEQGTWHRPVVREGGNTRLHPVLGSRGAVREELKKKWIKSKKEAKLLDDLLPIGEEEKESGGVHKLDHRIFSDVMLCKHQAIFVPQRQQPTTSSPSVLDPASTLLQSWDLLLCGGGANIFHFNPLFNNILLIHIYFYSNTKKDNSDITEAEWFEIEVKHASSGL